MMRRLATLCVAIGVTGSLACSDRSSPAAPSSPDSTMIGPANLVRQCTAAPNAVRIAHSFYTDSAGAFARGTVYVGDTTSAYAPSFGYFIAGLFGSAALVNQNIQYVAPTNCVGVDSAWYTGTPWGSPRKLDTLLYVFTITEPKILARDSATLIAGGAVTVDALMPLPRAKWTDPHIVKFLGRSRGTVAATSDSLLAYTAPATFAGVDTVTMIAEATYKAAVIRDTTTVLLRVHSRTPAPSYSVTPVVGTDSSAVLTAQGLSTTGRVAGTMTLADGTTHAFGWTNGSFRDLGTYSGSRTEGVGINASGAVAGFARLADSSYQGLVWYPDGTVATVPGGRPVPVGITDDGTVLTEQGADYAAEGVYWRNGQVVTHVLGTPFRLTYSGIATSTFELFFGYEGVAVTFPDGQHSEVEADRSSAPLAANSAADVLVLGIPAGPYPFHTALFEQVTPNEYDPPAVAPDSLWPETVPPAYVTPPFADTLVTAGRLPPGPLALNADRSYLTQTTVVTPHGAFAIDPAISDKSWHLVRAVTMNDAGQILAIAYNSVTGARAPILLTPR